MTVTLSTSDIVNPEVNRVFFTGLVATTPDPSGIARAEIVEFITCTGTVVCNFGSSSGTRREDVVFPIPDDFKNAITLDDPLLGFIHATATGSPASFTTGGGVLAVDSVDTFIADDPVTHKPAIWVRAALAADEGLAINRMAYQVDILLGHRVQG